MSSSPKTTDKPKFLCHCMKISKETVTDCIKNGCNSLEEIVDCTGAGSACTACHNKIEKIINENNNEKTKSGQ